MNLLSVFIKVNAFEKMFLFPKLEQYCREHSITCTIEDGGKRGTYHMVATADPEVIEDCHQSLLDLSAKYPGRIQSINISKKDD